jgi:hypothetical protein
LSKNRHGINLAFIDNEAQNWGNRTGGGINVAGQFPPISATAPRRRASTSWAQLLAGWAPLGIRVL